METPHYFSVPNYANSPQRLVDALITFEGGGGTGAAAQASADPVTGAITAITVTSGGSGYTSPPTVTFTSAVAGGSGAAATASIDANGAVSAVSVDSGGAGYLTPGIRKFVDSLPVLCDLTKGPCTENENHQYIPIAVADTNTYSGSDYYEIAVVQYEEQMHSDLPPTLLRGYVQLETPENASISKHLALANANLDGTSTPILLNGQPVYAVDKPHYLGPVISATKDKPVRILFRNLLPTGVDGNLFIPVDTTVMGAGMGPGMGGMHEHDPQNPMCGMIPKPVDCYTENRATLHLHGGISPWISDGTPHQWITPADENTPYPEGVSVQNVPDMPDPGPGAMTFFYTNQQSARLMFYHDHAWGITRLNVYAGEAAGYLITDPTEQKLVEDSVLPADQIPLVIQDKTFVPDAAQLATQDPTWDMARWGDEGDLWVPHVYSPAQNPGDSSGVNQFGRWAYGPWFWPPTTNIDYPPVANPYYDPNCNPDETWCEPPLIPGVPNVSMGMEAFNDTPLVNGTVYPTLAVEPKSYRLRILNAANDRFFNLSLYKAVDANGVVCDASNLNPAPEASGETCTEVALNPAEVAAALEDTTIFPTPVSGTEGPDWIQIGTEGGFLPAPVEIPAQFTTWVNDPTVFNAGNVDQHSLLLGPAERADAVVDFSAFAGQTLILYNDAPAAFPARDPRYDYYTGNADLRDTGGAAPTPAGYGPNTRTVMQIRVAPAPVAESYNLGALQTAFKATSLGGQGVFENSQHPIIVGQNPYNSAYGTSFRFNGPEAGLVQIFDTQFSFKTLANGAAGPSLTIPLKPKQIQDEMGEAFEKEYGRMSGFLGLEAPGLNANQQNMILYPFVNPATEILDGIELPPGVEVTPISSAADGTQIWKITHNGVDTHPIHFHLTDVQLINRVGWDGIIRRPDPNELGWKDTVRISPLEDTIVALRPILPKMPFGLLDSIRPLNPMMPLGSTAMFNSTDTNGNPINPPITNQIVNFGWEYVWHCHILSHEEMDMMRPLSVNVARNLPAAPVLSLTGSPGNPVALSWTDGTPVTTNLATWGDPAAEVGYRIERATGTGAFASIGSALANKTAFTDDSTASNTSYKYRVVAFNAAGDSVSNVVTIGPAVQTPAAPTNLVGEILFNPTRIRLSWTDNANNETSYLISRTPAVPGWTSPVTLTANRTSYVDSRVALGGSYTYSLVARNASGSSPSATVTVTITAPPNAPSNLRVNWVTTNSVTLGWRDNQGAPSEAGYEIWVSRNGTTWTLAGTVSSNVTTFTHTGLSRRTTYFYHVRAFANGTPKIYSAWSNTVNTRTR
jgi:FtsP/CotA-like multicopper oxidase with cupredoxin domain